jgi:hypothetical protein
MPAHCIAPRFSYPKHTELEKIFCKFIHLQFLGACLHKIHDSFPWIHVVKAGQGIPNLREWWRDHMNPSREH